MYAENLLSCAIGDAAEFKVGDVVVVITLAQQNPHWGGPPTPERHEIGQIKKIEPDLGRGTVEYRVAKQTKMGFHKSSEIFIHHGNKIELLKKGVNDACI